MTSLALNNRALEYSFCFQVMETCVWSGNFRMNLKSRVKFGNLKINGHTVKESIYILLRGKIIFSGETARPLFSCRATLKGNNLLPGEQILTFKISNQLL